MIRLLIVDDQAIIRRGLRSLLELVSEFEIVGEAEHGKQAIEQLITLQAIEQLPDVVLMDVRMPVMDGVAATRDICQQFPDLNVLVLTTFDDDDYISRAMQFGASGYLLKDTPPEELASAIQGVYRGYTHLGPGLFQKFVAHTAKTESAPTSTTSLPPELASLTPREREVLCLIATGANNREIAQSLYISERTVKAHITSILGRLNLRDRTQAAILATSFLSLL